MIGRWIIVVVFFLAGAGSGAQTPGEDPHWQLFFHEPFDSLDSGVWKVANNFDHYGEPQVYTDRQENVYLDSGELVLRVRKEDYRCRELYGWACNRSRYDYTSGWVETRPVRYVRFGYLESRILVPHGYGFWPAFWTFVGEDVNPKRNAAEIDIFEMLGTAPPTVMGTNLHVEYCRCETVECDCAHLNDYMCPEKDSAILCHQMDVEIPDYSAGYQVYGMEWNPSRITWYVNGEVVRVSANPGITDPVRIIFNLAISPWDLPGPSTPFPSEMRIDYLKVFRLVSDGERLDSSRFDFERHDWQVKREIRLGSDSTKIEVPPFGQHTLRALDGIEIRGDFTVPPGGELYLDAHKLETE